MREDESWKDHFTPRGLRNQAYGWDRIENVLWRVYHGELDGFDAEQVLTMLGTNNLHLNTDAEIITGLKLLIQAIKVRQPNAELVLMGILPRRDQEERVENLNEQIKSLASELNIKYNYIGDIFLKEDKKIEESLFSDGLHPNKAGYLKMRSVLLPILDEN